MGEERRPVTLADVAAAAGVSVSTASRALNGKASVASPMRKAVQDAIEQLGYIPDPAARTLRSRKAGAIGALVADLSYEPLLQLVRAADERAAQLGYVLAIRDSRGSADVERSHVRQLRSQRVDGILIVGAAFDADAIREVARAGIPVAPDFILDDARLFAARASAEASAVTDAVADLLRTGHQRLLFANAANTFPSALRGRLHVWEKACAETPLRFDEHDIINASAPRLSAALQESLDDRKTCIIAATQPSLTHTLRSLATIGKDIPDDVSLIAFGDPEWTQAWRPPISVIARDMVEEGRRYIERLVGAIHGPAPAPASAGHFAPSTYTRRGSVT